MFVEKNIVQKFEEYILSKYPNAIVGSNKAERYTSVQEEFGLLKNSVGVRIITEPALIKMNGKDSLDFLHRISTNDVKALKPFQKKHTLFLNEKGRFIAPSILLVNENEIFVLSHYDNEHRLFSWINKFIIMEDIKTENVSAHFALLEIMGPQAESFLTLLLGSELNKVGNDDFKRFDIDGFTFFFFYDVNNNKRFFKILIEKIKIAELIEYFFNIKSVFELGLLGEEAYKNFRIENRIPYFPDELNFNTNPHETNLIKEVSFTKGCYIGQEIIARLDTYDKVQRKLTRVSFSEVINTAPNVVYDAEQNEAGVITSIASSEIFKPQIGLALIKKRFLKDSVNLYTILGDKKIAVAIADE